MKEGLTKKYERTRRKTYKGERPRRKEEGKCEGYKVGRRSVRKGKEGGRKDVTEAAEEGKPPGKGEKGGRNEKDGKV